LAPVGAAAPDGKSSGSAVCSNIDPTAGGLFSRTTGIIESRERAWAS
jgi:hypothetical protein